MPVPCPPRALRLALAACLLSAFQLLTSGCSTTSPQACNKEPYRYLVHPGDTFQYFRDMLRDDELRCAYDVLSQRLRDEFGYSQFSLFVHSEDARPHVARLQAAEYVDSFWMDTDGTKAVLRLKSEGEHADVPMVLEDDEWHADWNIDQI